MATDATTHPGQTAHRLAGLSVAAQIGFGDYRARLPKSAADATNLLSNGLFLSAAGNVPTGWGAAPAEFTYSLSAGALPILGNVWALSFTGVTTARTINGPAIILSAAGLSAGDTLRFFGRIKTTGFEANGVGQSIGRGRADLIVNAAWVGPGGSFSLTPTIGADIDGIFEATAVIPAGTTQLQPRIYLGRSGTASAISGSFELSQLAISKIA